MIAPHSGRRLVIAFALVALLAQVPGAAVAQNEEQPQPHRLQFVAALTHEAVESITSVAISADGKFLYAAAYTANSIHVFSRHAESGSLDLVQTLRDDRLLDAVVALRLSPDEKYASATAFRSDTVVLFSRDADTGILEIVDSKRHAENAEFSLDFAIESAWSPDSNYLYVLAPMSAAVSVFHVGDDGLTFVEAQKGKDRCLAGARGIALDSQGKHIYVAAETLGTLVVLKRDAGNGQTELLEVHRDGQNEINTLAGAFSTAISGDDRFVYVSSGRFRGDNAVTAFERDDNGRLKQVQALVSGTDALRDFVGGNEFTIAPGGQAAYAVASRSHTLSVFDRDPNTGRLSQTQVLKSKTNGVGPLGTASGVVASPDGRFVYVAAETDDSISLFRTEQPKEPAAEEAEDGKDQDSP